MYKILKNEMLTSNIYLLEVEAPLIANKCNPGEFVIVMSSETSERIPLTIYKYENGIISMIYQALGASTLELTKNHDSLYAIVGPLGNKSKFVGKDDLEGKRYLLVAGGVGIAPIMPQAWYLKNHGAIVDIVYGCKDASSVILEEEIREVADKVIITTDDGSRGLKGFVTQGVKTINETYDECICIGPVIMMKFVCILTQEKGIPTTVSMNPIMVDGTGMCGACRLIVDKQVKFACVDGPEFDGHKVDFDTAIKRMNIYKTEEGRLYLKEIEGSSHHGGCGKCGD